jgi:hypothetical protein
MTNKIESIQEGTVVFGLQLHKDTVRFLRKHSLHDGVKQYEIDAKSRPLLVINRKSKKHGKKWFTVLAITSKGLDEKGKPKAGYLPLGNSIDEAHQSFVKLASEEIPENFISDDGSTCNIVKVLDALTYQNIMKIHLNSIMKSQPSTGSVNISMPSV